MYSYNYAARYTNQIQPVYYACPAISLGCSYEYTYMISPRTNVYYKPCPDYPVYQAYPAYKSPTVECLACSFESLSRSSSFSSYPNTYNIARSTRTSSPAQTLEQVSSAGSLNSSRESLASTSSPVIRLNETANEQKILDILHHANINLQSTNAKPFLKQLRDNVFSNDSSWKDVINNIINKVSVSPKTAAKILKGPKRLSPTKQETEIHHHNVTLGDTTVLNISNNQRREAGTQMASRDSLTRLTTPMYSNYRNDGTQFNLPTQVPLQPDSYVASPSCVRTPMVTTHPLIPAPALENNYDSPSNLNHKLVLPDTPLGRSENVSAAASTESNDFSAVLPDTNLCGVNHVNHRTPEEQPLPAVMGLFRVAIDTDTSSSVSMPDLAERRGFNSPPLDNSMFGHTEDEITTQKLSPMN